MILQYPKGTLHHGLVFHKYFDMRLLAFHDFDWGSELNDQNSTSKFYVYLGSNLIS